MTLRRRNFLGLLGAAIAAPLMPLATSAAGYSRTTYDLAIAHAQKYPLVSVSGMSKRIGITTTQAKTIITDMSSDGLLGAINPTRPGTIRASSKIFSNDAYGLIRTAKPRPVQPPKQTTHKPVQSAPKANLDLMLAHLHKLCVSRGMSLSPRCFVEATV